MRLAIPWTLQRTVPPGTVVTTPELKTHLRETLVDAGNDAFITALGKAAEDALERALSRALLQQTWVLRLARFPLCEIRLPRPPLVSVSSISYLDTAGSLVVLDPSQYTVDTSAEPGRILVPYGVIWPVTRDIENAVTITYLAGHATAADVPEVLKAAVKLLVGDLYAHRERTAVDAAIAELPVFERLAVNYRCETEFNYYT